MKKVFFLAKAKVLFVNSGKGFFRKLCIDTKERIGLCEELLLFGGQVERQWWK